MQNTQRWPRALTLVLLVWFLSAMPASATEPEWVFQHGKTPPLGLTWDRLGSAYLGTFEWQDLGAKAAPIEASRMVVGAKSDPIAAALLAELGLNAAGALAIADEKVGPATGLVISAPDPDGQGRVVLFTGEDAKGVYQTFTTEVNLEVDGWLCIRERQVVRHGTWPLTTPFTFETEEPIVLRLDRRFFEAYERHRARKGDEAVLQAARSLLGYGVFFEAALGPRVDLFAFYRRLLVSNGKAVEQAEANFREQDLAKLVAELYSQAIQRLGIPDGPAPEVVFLIGDPDGTNARTFGVDDVTGRPQVMLNVAAHSDLAALRISIAHELVHTFQRGGGSSLGWAALREGVAVFVSHELTGEVSEAALLMWSPEKLAAARKRRGEIVAAFREAIDKPRPKAGDWLILGRPLIAVDGAPDRAAYWLGYLSADAWYQAHPGAPLNKLLQLTPAELFACLR